MPTTAGDINPVTAAIELEIPNNIPAYWGAISTWLIRKPLYWNPVKIVPALILIGDLFLQVK
jgi:hypothetical protein